MNNIQCIIVAPILNEERYLKQWIDYHLNIGFDNFYLYNDDLNSQNNKHYEIVKEYNNVHLLNVSDIYLSSQEYISMFLQRKCCVDIISKKGIIKGTYNKTYVILLDVDEYIVLDNKYKNIKDYIIKTDCKDAYNFIWHIKDANNKIYPSNDGVYDIIKEYPNDAVFGKYNKNISKNTYNIGKQMVDIDLLSIEEIKYINIPHCLHNCKSEINNNVYINHYLTKSFSEFYNRLKNKGEFTIKWHRQMGDFFIINPSMIEMIPEIEKKFDIKVNKFVTSSQRLIQ